MNLKLMRSLGIIGGLLIVFLTTTEFIRSYKFGETKWFYLVMASGMVLLLSQVLFSKKK